MLVRTLVDDFARQLYLPRLARPSVLAEALRSGVAFLTWRMDTFAYAESLDESSGRYLGLRGGQQAALAPDDPGLIVKPDVAARQLAADVADPDPGDGGAPTPPGPAG